MLKDEVLKILLNKNDYVSGESICSGFGVSRSAVWRAIKKLEAEGYKIKSSTRIGYKLLAAPDMLNQAELEYEFNKSKLKDLKVELFNLRFQLATGQLENPMRIGGIRKDIARVKTIIRERELNAGKEA